MHRAFIWTCAVVAAALLLVTFSSADAALIGHYPLDSVGAAPAAGSGGSITPDTTGLNGPGVVNGAVGLSGGAGKIGGAFNFTPGSGNFVGINDAGYGQNAFTASVWFQPDVIDNGDPLANWTNAGGSPRTFLMRTNAGVFQTFVRDNGATQIGGTVNFPTQTLTTGDYNHAVITFDGQNLRTYLNGEVSPNVASFATPRPIGQGVQGTASIGGRGASEQNMGGLIDDVAFWNETLTDSKVAAIFNLANAPALNYHAGHADQLFQVFDGSSGKAVVGSVQVRNWEAATGLGGSAGDVIDLGNDEFFVNLDGNAGVRSSASHLQLMVDFNSNQDDGGDSTGASPAGSVATHNQSGFLSYHANHENPAEFSPETYGNVTVSINWPNTTDANVRQSIDRTDQDAAGNVLGGNDATWNNAAGDINLVTDWIGIDTRTGSGGNGNWDGVNGTPTYLTLTLSGLEEGTYDWTSFHHDTENVHGFFTVELSLDGGNTFLELPDGYMSDGSAGGSPNSATDGGMGTLLGPDVFSLLSTYQTTFMADGSNDVVFRFAPLAGTLGNAVHNQLFGINGFVLEQQVQSAVPEPASMTLLGLAGLALLGRRRRDAA